MFSYIKLKLDKLSNNTFLKFFKKTFVQQITLVTVFTILLFIIVVNNIAQEKISVEIGDIAPKDVRATKDIVDSVKTRELKLKVMEEVEPRHRVDPSIQVKVKNEIKEFFELVYEVKEYEDTTFETKVKLLAQDSNIDLTNENYNAALKASKESLNMLESNISDILSQIMGTGIKKEELEYEKENVKKIFNSLDDLPKNLKILGINIVNKSIRPNRFLDKETTDQKRREAAEQISPVIVKEGELIVKKGEKVDERIFELIKSTGLLKEKNGIDYSLNIGTLFIVLLLEGIVISYLYIFERRTINDVKHLVILSIIILSVILISKGISGISGYLIPISAATMLISILIDAKLAILINFVLAIIIGMITGNDVNNIIMLLIGGTVGAFGVINTNQRHNIFLTGLIVGVANVLTILSFGLIADVRIQELLSKVIYGLLNGLFSSILTIGSLPLWESIFSILTPLKLLELSNPNHPLLKKLLLEAPGTYHHSIIVGNLSEAAAEAIEGNTLIARVGAYYHDVGKLKRPYLFKENQFNNENPHNKLNPSLSTLIITSHVKDGVEMAQKYKLPNVITNIIREHHGNTLVAYFYHKALNCENNEHIDEDNFRYDGPKPQTKEAAIIMMADSVEAAVRSMKNPTKGKIEKLVREIIKNKLNDGQLDECNLTLKDLDVIANAFSNVLLGIFHERIEYPKLDLKDLKGGKLSGASNR
ncbi:HD family phosphohydrolase [Thermohalobacter berrensis]|uniref:Phosphohydrolase n=1 Tax=Thermohalobacter berrensis TaxID=99594 RepID=A0A419TB81_9FIRM|nr:HDIG domain-containing metalloprotein [Thermohalobacter berrensis]RKD34730.1 phosphohydrolase [Thermohalobacter berrensis]